MKNVFGALICIGVAALIISPKPLVEINVSIGDSKATKTYPEYKKWYSSFRKDGED